MRTGALPLFVAAFISSTPLAAHEANAPSLAPGEVLAQVSGSGSVRSQPEVARFRLVVSARNNDAAKAVAACDATVQNLKNKLRALGVPDRAITIMPQEMVRVGFMGNETDTSQATLGESSIAALLGAGAQGKLATVGVEIELTQMAHLAAVRKIVFELDGVDAQPPILSLLDETSARRSAVAQAVAKAKQEADAYANALGLRVVRITRVFDPETTPQSQLWPQMIRLMNGGNGNEVITYARVGLEAVLAPR